MDDLWPEDFSTMAPPKAPITLLKEQASLLGEKFRNLIEGKITTDSNKTGNFAHYFFIVAPSLEGYRFQVFRLYHNVWLYPVNIEVDTDIWQEEFPSFSEIKVENEESLKAVLRQIFGSKKMRQVIGALLAQIGSSDEGPF